MWPRYNMLLSSYATGHVVSNWRRVLHIGDFIAPGHRPTRHKVCPFQRGGVGESLSSWQSGLVVIDMCGHLISVTLVFDTS